ncbi:MAG: Stp1/IreP family PP2C-type Ser/Thr phosphatase [Firmicutes bacterium]|nr:Stp1/IreP family PP2C-type Ser/Thr phosphatase [Bacillota bacterium]
MKYGIKSHKGMIREVNEDSCNVIFGSSKMTAAFIVADGMGGHSAGEVASKMAVDYISECLGNIPENLDEENLHSFIEKVIEEANNIIYEKSREPGPYYGMGTTLVIALFFDKKLYIVHVGDSRAYMVRNRNIKQLTTDHSYVEELIKNGSLTRGEAENHPQKHVITRALGCFEKVQVDIYSYDIYNNDIFILCTDGLTNMLSDDKIKSIVEKNDDPQVACAELVEAANISGGNDNITVVIIRV